MSLLRRLTPLASMLLLAGALWVLHRELAAHHPREIAHAVRALPWGAVGLALALTALSYAFLPTYDALGLRYVGHRLGIGRTMLAGFLAYGFSQTLGFPLVTGGSLRYRLYASWGLSGAEIAQVIAVASLAFWLGVLTLAGVSLAAMPGSTLAVFRETTAGARGVGALLLLVPIGYVALAAIRRTPIRIRGWELRPPGVGLALGQVAAGVLDWLIAASVAYALLAPAVSTPALAFIGIFVLAQVAGFVSHVPGGIGVFEGMVLLLLKGEAPASALVGSLLVYRVIYYVVPFLVSAATLTAYELRARRAAVTEVARAAGAWLPALAPRVVAGLTFAVGAILVLSGTLPAERGRLAVLVDVVPLSVIEASHFLGSVAGVLLLVLAWGLARRLDAAFHIAVVLLGAGMAFSLLKGIDYEEAVASGVVLVALLAARPAFDRRASLVHEPFGNGWIVATGSVLVAATWLGFFLYRHVPYRGELWWQFALHGDAPRFLRATVGVVVAVGTVAVARLLRPARPAPTAPTAGDLEIVAPLVTSATRTYASLAFLADKSLLVSDERTAFLMYGTTGRSWIAMGDPVGDERAFRDLVWGFRELVDDHGGLTVFYQVPPETLPLYLDLGLRPLKLGEEARVNLSGFTLDGGGRKGLRRTKRRIEKEGGSFAVLPAEEVRDLLPELRRISDDWLATKQTREKRFSLGRFEPDYLCRFPVAVVRQHDRPVAFANVWTAGRSEIAPDVMRFDAAAPEGAMEYLFTELMQWGAVEGFEWFNLGMAPLSGMDARALAPLWYRINALVYRHGEHFYNFQGLRQYKEKFDPEWSPRYLASPGGLALPRVLADLTSLISGGLVGLVAR